MKVEEHEPLLMMSLKIESPLCLIFLLLISGALGNQWNVKYSKLKLCAVKGSTVVMEATYTHPTGVTVINRFWFINPVKSKEPTDLRNESGYSGRVEYLGDKQNHFSLRLSDVKKSDEHMYCFRFITTGKGYMGLPGITLRVTDLQLIAPAEVTEGESVILTCKTTCSLTDPTFIWYKNTHDLTTNTFKSNKLHLQRVSSEDAGSYSCAVRGSEHLPSPAQYLSVRYPPKNVSISLSGEIVEGSSVTLTCSSDANPPVETYTWFKGRTSVGKGKILTISKVSSEDSGEYKCMCSNKVGHQNSTSVTLNVLYPPKNVFISPSGEIVEGRLVTLTCSSDANPPVETYTWFKGRTSVGKEKTFTISKISSEDSGEYKCMCSNEVGHQNSISVTLNVLYPPKNVSISSSGEKVEGSSVTLTCSSDSNPPVETYTWFKENKTSPVGSGQSYRALQSGLYYCEVQNKLGSERSAAVSITITNQSVGVYAGVGVVCVCVIGVIILCKSKKYKLASTGEQSRKQDFYEYVAVNRVNAASGSASTNQDEVLYAKIVHQRAVDVGDAGSSAAITSAFGEDEVQYASVKFTRTGTDDRSSNAEDLTVIYSSIKCLPVYPTSASPTSTWF
ncbi:B-cell receptor CD22-like isoform X2 [Silurus meridionalis]|uniref:B-cell receptor CD22-like isoform X2 n=1 Tax=Silurus meridionalis TaxID=175797 RepID=UPI001EEC7BAC|nr:B-cell receptor CD22-like isoform X2 [Silurus meridionalis]